MYKLLICVPGKGQAQTQGLLSKISDKMAKLVSSYTFVKDMEEYGALSEEEKAVDIMVV